MARRLTIEDFIMKAKKIHGNKYDYSKVEYINTKTKVCIICPEHGEFWQLANDHLNNNSGCPVCAKNKKGTTASFIEKANIIHSNKYDYSKAEYINTHKKVCIVCPEHGEFWQTPACHVSMKQGCPKCKAVNISKKQSLSKSEFIKKAKYIHGNKYDYSKVEYINNRTHVCIICPEHGEFWQRPNDHLCGKGCIKCNESHLEKEISIFLNENKIKYFYQYKSKWLGKQSLDFYLPDYNIAIECQGIQHFFEIKYFGGKNGFVKRTKLDKNKQKLCKNNGVKLLYFSKSKNNSFMGDKVYHSSNEILKVLNENG